MTLDDLIQHIVLLHHEHKIKSICVSIVDDMGVIHSLKHIPPEQSLVAPTGVALLHMDTLDNLKSRTEPMSPIK